MVSYNEIVKIAKKQKKNVEANNELAHSYKWAYYFAWALLKPKQNIKSIKFGKASTSSGHDFKAKVPIEFILKWGKAMIKYVHANGKMPSCAVWGKVNISPKAYCYMFARAVVYYAKNGKLPKTVYVDTSLFRKKKKYGRSTEYGCNNRGQNNGYFCGPHMVQEIIRNLTGEVISQSELAAVIGTTSDGSDHAGINTSFEWFNRNYDYELKTEWKNFSEVGWDGLKKIHESNDQDAGEHELYRDTYGHYTNYDKIVNDFVYVHNSLGDTCNHGCYCGYTETRDKSDARRYLNGISQKSILVVTRVR